MAGDDVPIEEWAGEFSTVASLTPWAEVGIAKASLLIYREQVLKGLRGGWKTRNQVS